jgi:nucleotide-binding universal stress UspA family protein
MKKLLVPVDFSSHTEISCLYAVEIARATGAEIILFHSFFEQIYFSDGGFATGFESGIMLTDDIIRDFYKKKEKKLEEIAEELKEKAGRKNGEKFTVSYIIESGDPQIQILNAIGKIEPDLVVMGSAGLGKKGFLLGSVCKRIMDNTEVPVLALPDFREFMGLKNVLYVTEIEENDVEIISNLLSLLKDFHIHIHCLHLNVGNKDKDSDILMEALATHPGIKGLDDLIDFKVLDCEDPKASLMEYIRQNNIQLIAFIPHKKNFFKIFTKQDLTKEDLFLTGLPILGVQ